MLLSRAVLYPAGVSKTTPRILRPSSEFPAFGLQHDESVQAPFWKGITLTNILVTGANGFVGRALVPRLVAAGCDVTTAGRSPAQDDGASGRYVMVGDIGPQTDWSYALEGCQTVVHLGAQVPRRGVEASSYDVINNLGTQRLVEQAAGVSVKSFLYLSTSHAGVAGEDGSRLHVGSSYAASKLAGEAHVAAFAASGGFGISLRAPMVYGLEAKGNFRLLLQLAASNLPLPFGAVDNRRSVIAVENLADAILTVLRVPADFKLSGIYNVADATSVSLADIIALLRDGMGRPRRQFAVLPALLRMLLSKLGQSAMTEKMFGDLEVDSRPFRQAFDWTPTVDSEAALRAVGAALIQMRRGD